jgi:hypothetical protein
MPARVDHAKEHYDPMITKRLTRWTKTAGVFAAASILAASAAMSAANTASADPHNAGITKVGVGSDTIQDVMNAMAGERDCPQPNNDPTRFYSGISSASNGGAVGSFDAVPCGSPATQPSCIRTNALGPVFDRPNGSSQGITALSNSVNNVPYQNPSVRCTAAAVTIGANLNFARSSRGVNTPGAGQLSWVPFARDGVTFVYVTNGPTQADMQALTTANLTSLYTNQTLPNFGSTGGTVYPCLPQPGSGTRSFYETAIGVTNDTTAGAGPIAIGCNTLEEHDGNAFNTFATTFLSTHPNSAVVQAFSAAQYIAQQSGAAQDRSNNFRANGNGGVGNPPQIAGGPIVAGNPPTPNANYYNNATWGRLVYNVFQSSRVGSSPTLQDRQMKAMFNINGAGDAGGLCGQTATITKFGFLTIGATCGTIAATGDN